MGRQRVPAGGIGQPSPEGRQDCEGESVPRYFGERGVG